MYLQGLVPAHLLPAHLLPAHIFPALFIPALFLPAIPPLPPPYKTTMLPICFESTMASLLPFFAPSNRDFHPQMSRCLLYAAAQLILGTGMSSLELLSVNQHLLKVGECLPKNQLPIRTKDEIRQELLRLRQRWSRVSELKKIEAGLRGRPMSRLSIIRFSSSEYAFHKKVIFN